MDSFLENLDIPKLTENYMQALDEPISKNELHKTLISMNHNKTPGYDGLPTEFYVVFLGRYL